MTFGIDDILFLMWFVSATAKTSEDKRDDENNGQGDISPKC
ncbi:MAG: hypothetical protein ABI557_01915 [Aureliella sp.]